MDKHIYYSGAALVLALIIISFFIGKFSVSSKIEYIEKPFYKEAVKYDTIIKTIEQKPIYISKKSDTTIIIDNSQPIMTKPFIACIDTIEQGDTIKVKYAFPQDSFNLRIKKKSMLEREIIKTEYVFRVEKIERPLYVDILSHSGAGLLGGLIGYFIGKK